ncbi:hypothetical protein ASZ90_010531 [hydrocarbon metagenome]|uniref:DISARM protein DrmE C-terminal domain-containing protein n=1 Tax=hydrocarbon metagenome TaxID=938273 RepID=A0A0W8FFR3_9ZZZZ
MTITPLLALEALYYRLHEKKLPSGRDRLVIFSSRVELRQDIKEHFTSLKARTMPLYHDAFPVGRVTSKGEVFKVASGSGAPKLIISPGVAALPNNSVAERTFGAIIEATADVKEEQAQQIFEWAQQNKVPFLFFVSPDPPTELARALIQKGIIYWGWEPDSLAEDCQIDEANLKRGLFSLDQPFCMNYKEIRNKATGVKKIIIPVKEQKLNEMLLELRKDYYELARAAKSINSPRAMEVTKRLLGCIYALEEMISPLAYAETELSRRWGTIPVNRRIDALKNHCESIRPEQPIFASYALRIADKVLETYGYMAATKTGKHPIVIQIIIEASANGKSVLFVSKNEALNEALKTYLEVEKGMDISKLKNQGINFIPVSQIYRSVAEVNIVDSCILYGCPRYYQKDILSYARARSIGIMAYDSEISAIKYIQSETDNSLSLFSDIHKAKAIERLLGAKPNGRTLKRRPKGERKNTALIFINPQDAEMGEFAPKEIFSDFLSLDWRIDFEYANEAEAKSADQRLGKDLSDGITIAKIALPGDRCIMLHAEKLVQIYDESTEKVKDREAKNLRKGDQLILIENSTRKSLAESVISKVEAHPAMMEAVIFQKTWIHYLKQALEESGDTFIEVIRKLKMHGARNPSTPGSIFQWLSGAIIGPQDLENIRRIGIIYEMPFLTAKFDDIAKAVRRLRSIHRSLARRLNKLIPQAGIEADLRERENTVIDKELDLYLEDFANIVSIERIEAVEILKDVSSGDLDRVTYN